MYSLDGKLLWQRDEQLGLRFQHIYLGGSLVASRRMPIGEAVYGTIYRHTDALGSPIAATDELGNTLQTTEHEPYGKMLNRTNDNRPGYTGHMMDKATGLVYMQQRYYDPLIPRFLSVDPITAYSNPVGAFNRYWYANNNPYRFTDPDGRMDKETRKGLAEDRRSMSAHPSLRGSVATMGGVSSTGHSGDQGSRRSPAGSMGELARHIGGAVVDATNMTLYGEVSGAAGLGGTLSYSDNLRTGEQKLDLMGVIGEGVGLFAGAEVDILNFSIPGARNTPIIFNSGDLKVGDVVAAGLKFQFNPGGTVTLKGFGGVGGGGKVAINKSLSIGTTLWSNNDN
ncbi:hypothetical protein CQ393_12155 [Stenotrophomonas sp. MYb238]|uniref:RHS repeat-associated core domain-containing protein n=1 Tax=Stenotrophomonas sp. MYb238 TaxID=2040281 RepID=UPI0012925408|nr:RHS repeat-associated core domain-containing protein [Stenotrophomonas sp. MYb238]MQP76643.1 hypothetical protein [Stenotrophomonas sp. MYb238]